MNIDALKNELTYKAVRSSGSGGQHVNKVSSKVELYFNLQDSEVFNSEQKDILSEYLKHRISKNGVLMLSCSESRSQFRNKAMVTQRFFSLIEEGLKEAKERLVTKIPKSVVKKRLNSKRKLSEKKAFRKPPEID